MSPTLRHKNKVLSIDNAPLQARAISETYLTAEGTSGSGTITVKNILGFGINQILLIEDIGGENAEIIKTHTATTPSGTTVTLASNLVKTHPVGSKVRVILYDQFELSNATTATGSKTVLTVTPAGTFNPPSGLGSGLVAVDPTQLIQSHYSDEYTSGYFFARYKNSISSDFSDYSDALAYAGWDPDTVGYIIDRALRDSGARTLSDIVTRQDCYDWLTDCLTTYEGKQLRIPEHFNYNYEMTTLAGGDYRYTLPSDIYDNKTNRSILAIRIGSNGRPLRYLDPIEFEEEYDGVAETTAAEAGSVGETEIDLTNAADFADAGSVSYYVSGTLYSFTYTAKSGNTLTGIPASGSGSITQAFSSGDTMYQSILDGEPSFYTVREGSLDIGPIPDDEAHGKSIFMDYATVATTINSDGDSVDRRRYNMALSYLTWRIWCKARNNNQLDKNSGYYSDYKEALNDIIRTSVSGIKNTFRPKINRMRKK